MLQSLFHRAIKEEFLSFELKGPRQCLGLYYKFIHKKDLRAKQCLNAQEGPWRTNGTRPTEKQHPLYFNCTLISTFQTLFTVMKGSSCFCFGWVGFGGPQQECLGLLQTGYWRWFPQSLRDHAMSGIDLCLWMQITLSSLRGDRIWRWRKFSKSPLLERST